jgi:hypothetical protein
MRGVRVSPRLFSYKSEVFCLFNFPRRRRLSPSLCPSSLRRRLPMRVQPLLAPALTAHGSGGHQQGQPTSLGSGGWISRACGSFSAPAARPKPEQLSDGDRCNQLPHPLSVIYALSEWLVKVGLWPYASRELAMQLRPSSPINLIGQLQRASNECGRMEVNVQVYT